MVDIYRFYTDFYVSLHLQDHLRFSIANFEDAPEVDLDALLEDLCSMERDLANSTPTPVHPSPAMTNKGKTKIAVNEKEQSFDQSLDTSNIELAAFTPSSPSKTALSPVMVTHDVKERLAQTELESKELTPAEQEANIKAEKMRIALEKMKAASFQKLFIKVINCEQQTNKTMMIDQTWTGRDVKNKMMMKDDVEQGPNWCILEKLPELFMERILEDSEYVLQTVLDWPRETENTLVFLNRRDKYTLFRNPQNFLLTEKHSSEDKNLAEQSKEILLQEFFKKDSTQIPPSDGVLWLREGTKKWNKHYFALRASGLYYNPKGKQKSRDLVCLATFEHNNVYLGVGFKKKFKSPTDHVFCLKHPKVQTMKSKHIHALCAEDAKTKEHWTTVIRMAKYGYRMYADYLQTQEELESALMHGSMHTLSSNDSSGVGSGSITTASTFSTDSSSTLSLNQTLKKPGERTRNVKKNASAAPDRVEGKQNALGAIFSTAWEKGLEGRQVDYSSSSTYSGITESPWMSMSNSVDPSYNSEFDFTTSALRNGDQNTNGHLRTQSQTKMNGHAKNRGYSNGISNGHTNGHVDGGSIDSMLDALSDSVSNGTSSLTTSTSTSPPPPPPPPPPPLPHPKGSLKPSFASCSSPPPPPTPPPCPDEVPFGERRPQPPPQSSKPKKSTSTSAPPPPPPPPLPLDSKPL